MYFHQIQISTVLGRSSLYAKKLAIFLSGRNQTLENFRKCCILHLPQKQKHIPLTLKTLRLQKEEKLKEQNRSILQQNANAVTGRNYAVV